MRNQLLIEEGGRMYEGEILKVGETAVIVTGDEIYSKQPDIDYSTVCIVDSRDELAELLTETGGTFEEINND
jgi:hypothetical protein